MNNKKFLYIVFLIVSMFLLPAVFAQSETSQGGISNGENAENEIIQGGDASSSNTAVYKYFAAALAVGISCIAGGIAVAKIGAAAMGAMSENSELSGKALPYAGLAEGICLWGFLVALLILFL